MPLSIHSRLAIGASLVLLAFVILSGLSLEEAFRESLEHTARERLQGHVYGLLAEAQEDDAGRMGMPDELTDPRFTRPESGFYAQVRARDGSYQWDSPSLLGLPLDFARPGIVGTPRHDRRTFDGEEYLTLDFALTWEDVEGHGIDYTLSVAEHTGPMRAQAREFRFTLFAWLGGASLLLLIAQGVLLGWGLRPLRNLAAGLGRIEAGEAESLEGHYPAELQGLARNLNSLIAQSRAQQARYRNSLDDLAHSLKTPLAVLKGAVEAADDQALRRTAADQVERMDEIVRYRLQRAAAKGRAALGRVTPVGPQAERLLNALDKAYRAKGIQATLEADEAARFLGDPEDLMECLGNLLDNAYKYGRSRVHLDARQEGETLVIRVEDDGPGVAPEQVERLLRRGERGDEQAPGQGIGLGVVDEIVRLYGGRLTIECSEMGGAAMGVRIGDATTPAPAKPHPV